MTKNQMADYASPISPAPYENGRARKASETSMSICCRSLFVAFALVVCPASTVRAEGSSVGHGNGGYVPDFIAIIRQYNASGESFRIEGVCKSTCTMFLGIRNVCVERNATLMFHAGHNIKENVTGPNTRASRSPLYRYSPAPRQYLLANHLLDTSDYHALSGSVIIGQFGYRECPPREACHKFRVTRGGQSFGSKRLPCLIKIMRITARYCSSSPSPHPHKPAAPWR
jgi:hypothetical protein